MRPSKPVFELAGRRAFLIIWPRANAAVFVSAPIVLDENTVVTAAIGDVRVIRLWHRVGALAIGDLMPCGQRNHSADVRARPFKRPFVLLRAVNMKRKLIVNVHMVELAGRLIMFRAPGLSGIDRN